MATRREKIEAMLVDEPNDTFLRYSLALELDKEGASERSIALFEGLIRDNPPYVPAFFMAGQLMVRLDRIVEARKYLRDGIDEARNQQDHHAAAEMSQLLASLGGAGE
jgi:tetratricopeptide (TPR) repeat protein